MQHCLCAAIHVVFLRSCTCMSHECTKRLNLQDNRAALASRECKRESTECAPMKPNFGGRAGGPERFRGTCFPHDKSGPHAPISLTAMAWSCASNRMAHPYGLVPELSWTCLQILEAQRGISVVYVFPSVPNAGACARCWKPWRKNQLAH